MNIKKGDTVQLMRGKNRGKSGKVLSVFPKRDRVVVEGLNLYKKNVKPKQQGEKGQTIEVARPIHASNAMLICKSCNKPSRVGFRIEKTDVGGSVARTKKRYCKKCKSVF